MGRSGRQSVWSPYLCLAQDTAIPFPPSLFLSSQFCPFPVCAPAALSFLRSFTYPFLIMPFIMCSSSNIVYSAHAGNIAPSNLSLGTARPCTSSPLTSFPASSESSNPSNIPSVEMKDATVSSSKSSRPTAYPKKRPSPHPAGKSKSNAPAPIVHHSPHALKMQREQQRQREEQGADVGRREPIPPPEDEYREEFIINMHEMEVRLLCIS